MKRDCDEGVGMVAARRLNFNTSRFMFASCP